MQETADENKKAEEIKNETDCYRNRWQYCQC